MTQNQETTIYLYHNCNKLVRRYVYSCFTSLQQCQ